MNNGCLLAIKAKTSGKRLADVVTIARPETLLRWHKKLVAQKHLGGLMNFLKPEPQKLEEPPTTSNQTSNHLKH